MVGRRGLRPLETKDGSAMDTLMEKTINRSYHVPKMMDPYVKSQSQAHRDILHIHVRGSDIHISYIHIYIFI